MSGREGRAGCLSALLAFVVVGATALGSVHQASAQEGADQRRVLFELFTATWCPGCPYADAASELLKLDYGDRVSILQYHMGDDGFDTVPTNDRGEDYGVAGLPVLWMDGVDSRSGGSSTSELLEAYRPMLDGRLTAGPGLELDITAASLVQGNITVDVDLSAGTGTPGSFNVRFAIYENGLLYDVPNPGTRYNYVVRDLKVQSVSASSLPLSLSQDFAFNSSWNFSSMGAVVFAQMGSTGEVLQSSSRSFGLEDADGDGLPDDWELLKLGTVLYAGDDDPDGDGRTNLEEYQKRTDPMAKDVPGGQNDQLMWAGFGALVVAIVAVFSFLAFRKRDRSDIQIEDEEEAEDSEDGTLEEVADESQ